MSSDEQLWAAVGEPSRRLLLDALLAHGEASASTLAADVPFTRQAVAKHLAVLGRAGLVHARRDGREVRYAIRPERIDDAAQALADVSARWERRLADIKRRAEASVQDDHAQGIEQADDR